MAARDRPVDKVMRIGLEFQQTELCSDIWNRRHAGNRLDSTLAKGLGVIEWLARQPGESRVTDVARALGLARSNAHRTLQTLVACGWAVQNPASSAYRPSLRLFELGSRLGR